MDFSTLEKRQQFCLRELEINRRTAPDLYLDVVPVTRDSARDNRGLHLGETPGGEAVERSEEHTSELQSLMRISYAVFCLNKKKTRNEKQSQTTDSGHTTDIC